MMRILVIEDDPNLRRQLMHRLASDGIDARGSDDGREGLSLAQGYPHDAAVIDLGLPNLSGLAIRQLRAGGSLLPILILTARDRWQDKVEGLEGADDYLVKPFQPEELVARLRALTRRAAGTASRELTLGPLRLGPDRPARMDGGASGGADGLRIPATGTARDGRARCCPSRRWGTALYAHDEDRDSNVLEVLVGRLRRKLDPDGTLVPIETLRGRGYRLTLKDRSSDRTPTGAPPDNQAS